MAFHVVGSSVRIDERQRPYPGRPPVQPEDVTKFLLALH